MKTKTSSSAPLTPVVVKFPVVDRYTRPAASTAAASTFSCEVEMPTSEPSKYMAYVPLVVAPSELGVKMSRSSAPDETPGTLAEPSVDSTNFPFESSSKASTSSPDVVRPTSEPSKYTLNAPLVGVPSDVASKRMTCREWSPIVPATPGRVAPSESREKSRVVALSQPNASIRRLPRPTSEPSNARLNVVPL